MSGRIAEFKYLKRVNLGNYEHEEAQVTYIPSETESDDSIISATKTFLNKALNVEMLINKESEVKEKSEAKEKAIKETIKKSVAAPSAAAKENFQKAVKEVAKALNTEVVEEETLPEQTSEEVEEVVEETPVVEAKKEEKPKKVTKVKLKEVLYNREEQEHKKLLAEFLTANVPNWKSQKLTKVQQATATLVAEKVSFLGSEGISEEFSKRLLELIA